MEQENRPERRSHLSREWQYLVLLATPGILFLIVLFMVPSAYAISAFVLILCGCPAVGIGCGCLYVSGLDSVGRLGKVVIGVLMAAVFTATSLAIAYGGILLAHEFIK